ncbi:acyl-CoA thioester hydrolase [Azospirillum fermentarium]|uniref:thioesterase family protein n=1 Tax=Azospirillum fermentarium TaxID=1233114 RepID=UPI0022261AD9|nr:thioesterase family protein [Azospirillum fermentarium]MCW2246844.1 acyl-CoA thioester hydrolase [Azospirillum fermentarium]
MTDTAPLTLHRATVRPEWIDYNGHMNVAYYLLAFDQATDAVLDHLGIGKRYVEEENRSLFVVEAHLTYAREVTEGDGLVFDTLVLGADPKRLHLFHTMRHESEGFLAATAEFMLLHVDLSDRRAAPFPPAIGDRVTGLARRHAALPRPAQAGRAIALPARAADSGPRP